MTFPLITLQPIADSGNIWVGVQLESDPPADDAALAYVLRECGLAASLATVRCEVIADPATIDVALLADLPAGRITIHPPGDAANRHQPAKIEPAPHAKADASGRSLLLKLLALVTADADTAALEAIIKRDANLSYQLLKLVNSVAFSPSQKVTSFSQAIAMLGRRQLQRWLQLLLYTRAQGSKVASPLLPRVALRASLMEGLAKCMGLSHTAQDEAFMVGMFSMLDVLFGMPLRDVVIPLNLPDEVVQALIADSGQLGELKGIVLASEGGPSAVLATALDRQGIARAAWAAELVKAYGWAIQIGKEA